MFTPDGFLASIIFGSIGLAALIYGKNMSKTRPMILGAILMGYTYFFDDPLTVWLIGAALTAVLIFWKE